MRGQNGDRFKAAVGVAAFHVLIGYAFITGLAQEVVSRASEDLKMFNVVSPPPPPPVESPAPAKKQTAANEGAASPPNIRSKPTPVVAPPPKIRLDVPPPIATTPKATPVPADNDRTAGAADIAGPGSGSGGQGVGTGSGNSGSGTGGGLGAKARLERGRLANEDYPRAALRAGIEGSVAVQYTVDTAGRATDCRVIRSSGNADLDSTTCRLIEQRFRYKPATDAQGRPVPEVVRKVYDWLVPFKPRG